MSLRLLTTRIIRHGRTFLQNYWERDIHFNIYEPNKSRTRFRLHATSAASVTRNFVPNAAKNSINVVSNNSGSQNTYLVHQSGIFRFGQHARKLFVDNILNRVTTTYSEKLRTEATKRLFYGDSVPFFALIGVSLASGAGVLTKEDELEGVCWEIREAANRLQSAWNNDGVSKTLKPDFKIDQLDIGPPIAKGCAAVVYAASFRSEQSESADFCTTSADTSHDERKAAAMTATTRLPLKMQSFHPEFMSPIQQMSRFVHNFGGSENNLHIFNEGSGAAAFGSALAAAYKPEKHSTEEQTEMTHINGTDADFVDVSPSNAKGMQRPDDANASLDRYPLALKMMFNYDIQSNALFILRAMYKETVPARQRYLNDSSEDWERLINDQTVTLPPHPNIVCMLGFFCDEVRNFPDGHLLYPIAQPQRINPLGYGRNMSLYLLMKRYDYTLRALLDTHELNARTKVLLLAQLLEAVAHINRFGIAHRDLKSDNVLIELNDDSPTPVLVLSDFGCCLSDKAHGLQLPYPSFDIDKGGNAALMAPEIINKKPGPFAVLNYAKADLWACGTIAYEIFGLHNPFYSSIGGQVTSNGKKTNSLRNTDYKQNDLPPLGDECSLVVQQLISNILHPNPSKRLSPEKAANVMQLYLWAPSQWLKPGGMPHSPEILQWLLSLTTKLMHEGRPESAALSIFDQHLCYNKTGRRTYVEYLLICSFLARAQLRRVRSALNWIQSLL